MALTTPLERRSTRGVVEFRATDPGMPRIGGYAILYNTYSMNLGGYVEQAAPGFVDKSLADAVDVLCRFQHDSDMLLGRVSSGTLRLASDSTGVEYDDDLPDTGYARDLASLCKRGDVRNSSFAFRVAPDGDEWGYTPDGFPLRTLRACQLVDVAPVVSPGYLDTTSSLRSLAERRSLDPDLVLKAASVNELGQLLRSKDPKVIDLKPAPPEHRDGNCQCCQTCGSMADGCPGCACTECRQCPGTGTTRSDPGQRETHPCLSVTALRRRLDLERRRNAY
jgi:HK97 family phage prohead protease